jgi:hypothetical protein
VQTEYIEGHCECREKEMCEEMSKEAVGPPEYEAAAEEYEAAEY